jgi:hypothetical protein
MKKSIMSFCGVALLAAAFALPASAQDARQNAPLRAQATYINMNGGGDKLPPAFTIFSNFGTPAATNSWVGTGYYILGPTGLSPDPQQTIGLAFKPKVNSHVTKIEVPVQCDNQTTAPPACNAGTTGFEQSLQADCAGIPCGVPIAGTAYKQQVANTSFYACCTAAEAKVQTFAGAGIALTAGTQYWVVVDANPAGDTTTLDVWADSGTQLQSAQEGGSTTAFFAFAGNGASAVSVTGTNP